MIINSTPGMIIAGTGSGCGKTSISVGIAAYLRSAGLRVQSFKVGPDYLDPTWLGRASGRQCINLDSWMTDPEYVKNIFCESMRDADFALIEGVMGLYDGAEASSISGSTAEIAIILGVPIYLIVNVRGMAGTVSAVVRGCSEFSKDILIGGVFANYCASERHAKIISDSLHSSGRIGLKGWFSQGELGDLPGRHLGLLSADDVRSAEKIIAGNAESVKNKVSFAGILSEENKKSDFFSVSENISEIKIEKKYDYSGELLIRDYLYRREMDAACKKEECESEVIIGVACDDAFYFYYPDNLNLLRKAGAKIIFFSPLEDATLPENIDALYIGGGYPELHAEKLSENSTMRKSVYDHFARGKFIYAECGGLMYLSSAIETVSGGNYPMSGVFSFSTKMLIKRKALGYVEAQSPISGSFFDENSSIRGHEFHYSEIADENSARLGYLPMYKIKKRNALIDRDEGYVAKNVFASYVHIHFASSAVMASKFIQAVKQTKMENIAQREFGIQK